MVRKHIILTGFMGSGKSTVGKYIAGKLNLNFIDCDIQIEQLFRKTIKEIFASEGEAWFRLQEENIVQQVCVTDTRTVISLGGGALMSDQSLKIVKESGILIFIQTGPEEIWQRIRHSHKRPLLDQSAEKQDKEEFMQQLQILLEKRKEGYAQADIVVERQWRESVEVADLIIEKLKNLER